MKRSLAFVLAGCVFGSVAAVGVAGQAQGDCFRCADDVLNEEHKIEAPDGPPPPHLWTAADPHSWEPDNCLESAHGHEICEGGGSGGSQDEDIAPLLALVGDWVQRESLAGAQAILNADRNAIQFRDCHGHVIAHLPLATLWTVEDGAPAAYGSRALVGPLEGAFSPTLVGWTPSVRSWGS